MKAGQHIYSREHIYVPIPIPLSNHLHHKIKEQRVVILFTLYITNSDFTVNIEEKMHNEKDWFGWWHWS